MLERVWRKGNPPTPLAGMEVGAATVENNMEVPLKSKNRLSAQPPLCRHHGHEPCAAHQACQGHQGAGRDRFTGTVHAGAHRIHGLHEPSIIRDVKGPVRKGDVLSPTRVTARGSEAVLNLGLGPGRLVTTWPTRVTRC